MAIATTIPISKKFHAPDFTLMDAVTQQYYTLHQLKGKKATVIMFLCNHCPYVLHILPSLIKLIGDFLVLDIAFIGISSNDITQYPEDSPENMKKLAKNWNFNFPYLYDESQDVAKMYQTACTPDFNIFDENMLCIYRGQFDEARPNNNIPVTGIDIRSVLTDLVKRRPIKITHPIPSVGCSIKWKQ